MKPKVLIFLQYYLPGFKAGGPVRSVANIVTQLAMDFDFHVVCLGRDFTNSETYAGVQLRSWLDLGGARVFYGERRDMTPWRLATQLHGLKYELVYLNSFFDSLFSISPLLAMRMGLLLHCPVVLAPRGEFSSGALELKKVRKRALIALSRLTRFHSRVIWHATSEGERQDIKAVMGDHARIPAIVPNIVDPVIQKVAVMQRSRNGVLRLVFFSRITPKKNLELAIRIIRRMSTPVVLDIWGPIDDSVYWAQCERLVAQCPSHVAVQYRGVVAHEKVAHMLAEYDVLFLPTRGENFGHVIFESLASGTPILISDQTPWKNVVQAGIGFDISLSDENGFLAALQHFANMSGADFVQCRNACIKYASHWAERSNAAAATRRLFVSALEL